jgi:hypothetical protein
MRSHEAEVLIQRAFGDTSRPTDAELFLGPRDSQVGVLWSELAGKRWNDVDVQCVPAEVALLRFTPGGFHYFLPAYMLACVEGRAQETAAWIAALSFLSPLTGDDAWRTNVFAPRSALFDSAQVEAILAFLGHSCVRDELILEDPDAPMVAEWNAAMEFWTARLQMLS